MDKRKKSYKEELEEAIAENRKLELRASRYLQCFTIHIIPGDVVERNSAVKFGELVPISPLLQGIVRRVLISGTFEFLLGTTVVKLEPFYLLKEDETLAIRRRPGINLLIVSDESSSEVHQIRKYCFIVFTRMLANRDLHQGWKRDNRKMESLYSYNNEIIVAGHVVEVYNDGIVISADLVNYEDFTSWIFLKIEDLKDIYVFPHETYCSLEQATSYIEEVKARHRTLLQFDAGMFVFANKQLPAKRIQTITWKLDNILDRQATFDSKLTVNIDSLTPSLPNREVFEHIPSHHSHLKLSTGAVFTGPNNTKYKIYRFDNEGVIGKFVTDQPLNNSYHHSWFPYSFFEKHT